MKRRSLFTSALFAGICTVANRVFTSIDEVQEKGNYVKKFSRGVYLELEDRATLQKLDMIPEKFLQDVNAGGQVISHHAVLKEDSTER